MCSLQSKELRYTVVIRTLGTAGEKYQILLDSLCRQTIQPDKILVYIPEGYPLPKETCEREVYIRCKKGMIHQRSLPFDEVETDWILFCDDDISLESDSVERLWQGVYTHKNSACISPDVFPIREAAFVEKIKYCLGFTLPHYKKDWAFIIRSSGHYSYNNIKKQNRKDVLKTQSAAFPCCLVEKKAYKSVHFEDERFLDDFKYSLGDDLLFYYKLYRMGFNPLVHYNAGIVHLDAGSSHVKNQKERLKLSTASQYVVWHRCRYSTAENIFRKLWCCLCYWLTVIIRFLYLFFRGLMKLQVSKSFIYLSGIIYGVRYTHKKKYKNLPAYLRFK